MTSGGLLVYTRMVSLKEVAPLGVDCLYVSLDLPNVPRERLIEEFLNEGAPTDGEIFYKIRQYNKDNDKANELKWWARLTETKRKDLRQLLKYQRYVDIFDSMLQWPGLWTPIKLGCLHRLLGMRCDEVCSHGDTSTELLLIGYRSFSLTLNMSHRHGVISLRTSAAKT